MNKPIDPEQCYTDIRIVQDKRAYCGTHQRNYEACLSIALTDRDARLHQIAQIIKSETERNGNRRAWYATIRADDAARIERLADGAERGL